MLQKHDEHKILTIFYNFNFLLHFTSAGIINTIFMQCLYNATVRLYSNHIEPNIWGAGRCMK